MNPSDALDIIIPVTMDTQWNTSEEIIAEIRERYENYGFTRFALDCPSKGWRGISYPPTEHFAELARMFAGIRDTLAPLGIDCGWWITTTVKSGLHPAFSPIIRTNGTAHPFANCPLDPAFRKRLASDIALFAKIGKPSFIITEDDYSIHAASSDFGCFCPHHLAEFARREQHDYTREELIECFRSETAEGYALLRRWRSLARDTLVGLAEEIRQAVDKVNPDIPIGYMQSGSCDRDGDVTQAVSQAFAGSRHTPFSRLFGTFYGGVTPEEIPSHLFHAFYSKQHIDGDFRFYHESDTFPHTRFYTSGREIVAIMSAAYAMGFDGSTFQTQQVLDRGGEEPAYATAFSKERSRLNALHYAAKKCRPAGAALSYDPFWNNVGHAITCPLWTNPVSLFSIPWITTESDIVFFDKKNAESATDDTLRNILSKPLVFLDGEAAQILSSRGYGALLGVQMGAPINDLPENAMLQWDLGANEVIRKEFTDGNTGRRMHSAHMLANSNGQMLKMEITDPSCEILADMIAYDKRVITPSITRFRNRLGGTVITMAITLDGNDSQSLLNYRRQRLVHSLIIEHCDSLVFVREAPRVFTLMNEAAAEDAEFDHLLTLINLSSDPLEEARIHLPPHWKNGTEILTLSQDGEWIPARYRKTEDGITLTDPLEPLAPLCLMFR